MKNFGFEENVFGCRKRRPNSGFRARAGRYLYLMFFAGVLTVFGIVPSLAQRSINVESTGSVESTERSLLNEIPRIIVSARCKADCEYLKFRLFEKEYTFTIKYGSDAPSNADSLSRLIEKLLSVSIPSSKFSFVPNSADLTFEFAELYDVSLRESSEFCSFKRPVDAGIENSTIKLWFDFENGRVLLNCLSAAMLDLADFPELSFVAAADQPSRGAFEKMILRTLVNIRALGKKSLSVDEFHALLSSD